MKAFAVKQKRAPPSARSRIASSHAATVPVLAARNDNVRRIVQPKLTIGQANDRYEQEADRVADRVVANQPVADITPISGSLGNPVKLVARAENLAEEEELRRQVDDEQEQDVQPKYLQRQMEGQPADDIQSKPLQREAAEEDEEIRPKLLQRQPEEDEPELQPKLLQRQAEEEEGEEPAQLLQRQSDQDEEEIQPKPLQRRGDEDEDDLVQAKGPVGSSSAAARAIGERSGGSPLRPDVRATLEAGIGADLSAVRVHEDGNAHQAAASINAKAFTHKSDIWLGEGQSQSDIRLMAHEATHVVQQGGGLRAMRISRSPARVQRIWNPITAVSNAVSSAVEWVGDTIGSAIDYIKERALEFVQDIPGYSLFTVVNGSDPITGRSVERNGRNFIEAGLDIIPNGESLKQKLEQEGALDEAAAWLDNEIRELDFSPTEIASQFREFWGSLGIEDATRLPTVLRRLSNIVTAPIGRIVRFARNVAAKLLEIVKNYVISSLINFIREQTHAYPLLTVILGRDPISNEPVERTPIALLRGFMQLSESGQEQLRQMEESGSLQRAADWLDGAVARLNITWEMIRESFARAWDLVTIQNLLDPIGTFREIYNIFTGPVGRIVNFLIEVAAKVLGFIKDALINRLVEYARTVRGYPLITVILGKDPFSEEPVERTTANIIRGFMSLMENGEQQYQEMEQSGAIARMTARVEAAMAVLNFTWEYVRGLFLRAWNSFSLQDLAAPFQAFARLMNIFAAPIMRLVAFVWEIIKIVIEVIMEVMNFPIDLIRNIISRAMQAIDDIKRDPIGFLKNLLLAVKTGFQQFFGNILTHLLNGLTGWLFSELRDANINPPADLSFRSILGFVLEVLGITVERIWQKLAERIGQERVDRIRGMIDRLTGIWSFVKDVMTRGPVAIWEYIQERLSNLWDTVLEAVRNWVMTRIVERITVRLLSMLDPTGIMAVINGFIAFYNAVQSFIRYLREMLEIVNSFVVGVAELARGNVTIAANFLEGALARGVPVAIGFLANQVGLSGIGRRIGEMIERVRALVDRALTWLVDRAVSAGTAFLNTVRGALGIGAGDSDDQPGETSGAADWRDESGVYREEGHQHRVSFNGRDVLVASEDPTRLEDLKVEREQRVGSLNDEQLRAYNSALAMKSELETLTDEFSQAQMSNDTNLVASKERLIGEKLQSLANLLEDADLFSGVTPLDPTRVTFALDGGKAGSVMAEPLTRVPGNTQGEAQSGGGPELEGWEYVSNVNSMSYILNSDGKPMTTSSGRLRLSKPWKKVHVLSHLLHGPRRVWNLTPGEQVMNSAFLSAFERTVKDATNEGKTISLSIRLHYYANQGRVKAMLQGGRTLTANDSDFVESATVTMGEKNDETGAYDTVPMTVDGTPLPSVEGASMEFTIRHLKSAIDRNVGSLADQSRVKIWSAYRRDHINRNLQIRLGDDTLADLHDHYRKKVREKFGE